MMKNGMSIEKGTPEEFLSGDIFYADFCITASSVKRNLVYLYNFFNIIDFLKNCALNSSL